MSTDAEGDDALEPSPFLGPDRSRPASYWDINDVQFHCRVSRKTAWRLVRRSGFPSPALIGRRVIWPRAEVIAFIEEQRDPNHYVEAVHEVSTAQRTPTFTSRQVGRRAG